MSPPATAAALETRQLPTATPDAAAIGPFMGRSGTVDNVICPSAGTAGAFGSSYTIGALDVAPTCQILPGGTSPHVLQ